MFRFFKKRKFTDKEIHQIAVEIKKAGLRLVPDDDYQWMRSMRINLAKRKKLEFNPEDFSSDKWQQQNAEILSKHYDLTETEALYVTGYWVG